MADESQRKLKLGWTANSLRVTRIPDMRMKLSKRIPARTKTIQARWCKAEWTKCTKKYREIRNSIRSGSMQTCYWCKHHFSDGEMMAIAAFDVGNKTLCQMCAKELQES